MARLLLDLGEDAIRLISEEAGTCAVLAAATFSDDGRIERLEALRTAARRFAGERPEVTLILPASQVLFTRVDAPGPSDANRAMQVLEGLDGLTPYAVRDLAIDWWADGVEAAVAVVTRTTLDEAFAFASEQGFGVTAISAAPPDDFGTAPSFPVPESGREIGPGARRLARISMEARRAVLETRGRLSMARGTVSLGSLAAIAAAGTSIGRLGLRVAPAGHAASDGARRLGTSLASGGIALRHGVTRAHRETGAVLSRLVSATGPRTRVAGGASAVAAAGLTVFLLIPEEELPQPALAAAALDAGILAETARIEPPAGSAPAFELRFRPAPQPVADRSREIALRYDRPGRAPALPAEVASAGPRDDLLPEGGGPRVAVADDPIISREAAAALAALVPASEATPAKPLPLPQSIAGLSTTGPAPPVGAEPTEIDSLYLASIDPITRSADAFALNRPEDGQRPATPLPPAPDGTVFALDERGMVAATAEGALTPSGIVVVSGRPDIVPPDSRPPLVVAGLPNADAANVEPRARPSNLVEMNERARFGGRTLAELATLRPRVRTPAFEAVVVALRAPTPQAVPVSVRPDTRPASFTAVAATSANSPAPVRTAAAAAVVTTSRAVPSNASVARQATISDAIRLGDVNLIGVYGAPASRRALVRLSSGRFVKVGVGDQVDGGRVAAIGASDLSYVKGGRTHRLTIPSG